jgi:hypothetical protein
VDVEPVPDVFAVVALPVVGVPVVLVAAEVALVGPAVPAVVAPPDVAALVVELPVTGPSTPWEPPKPAELEVVESSFDDVPQAAIDVSAPINKTDFLMVPGDSHKAAR